jgi:iron complex transport system substrate-binding protein
MLLKLTYFNAKKKQTKNHKTVVTTGNSITYSKKSIFKHEGYSVVKFQTLGLKQIRTSYSKRKTAAFLTACKKYTTISVPLQTIVVTSTTNIPFWKCYTLKKI